MSLNLDRKFQGKTAKDMLKLIQEHWPNSFSDQVIEIDKVLNKAEDSIKNLGSEMRSELAAMVNQKELSERELEHRWQAYIIKEIQKTLQFAIEVFQKCPEMSKTILPSLYQALQELLAKLETMNYQSIIQSVTSLVETYYDQVVRAEQELSKKLDNQDVIENKEGTISANIYDEELVKILSSISMQKRYLGSLDGIMENINSTEAQKIFSLSAYIQGGAQNAHRDAIKQKIETIEDISGFIDELRYLSQEIRMQAELLEDPSETERQYMLNWIGSQADCKILIKFLFENGYLEGRSVDKFIAKHFLFNGKKKTSGQINGLHIEDRGKFMLFNDYLKIPTKS